ncbi:HAMP domain-containing sensor histidine kinase [Terrimonas ferruginea]|uniref:HAMP domain-containing sensor histidine kinase n=1 Tax=Terrimonas ferruginea TaxID=249 RepID=UPI0004297C96|nr:HAMP domain-containing sensor histidine kinase [Terrimonas ferruginea]
MKIQTQTALLFTFLAAAVILLLNGVIYYAASRDSSNDFKKRLELRVVVASKIYFEKDTTSTATYNELREQYLEKLPNEKEYVITVDQRSGALQIPQGLKLPETFYKQALAGSSTAYYDHDGVYYAGIQHKSPEATNIVVKSAVNMYGLQALRNLERILFIAFIGKVILVFTVSFFFSRKAFKPFRDIIARVKSIGVENLSLRLQEKKGKDETAELTRTFNGMLDRLETAFDIQNNFVSNASHELRTPLTTIIGEAEITLSRARTPETYQAALQAILKEAEKLEALTTALLSLAQSGFNKKKENLAPIRLDELLFDIHATISRIDPDNQVRLHLQDIPLDESKMTVTGNAQLLKLAISNIILNACKYSNNQDVVVRLSYQSGFVVLVVTDIGIGIPDAELQHVFVPFFRASNTGSFKGYGVGLPLALNIIRQHNGQIHVASEEGKGTIVTVQLPVMTNA